jgi:hypothetical protein
MVWTCPWHVIPVRALVHGICLIACPQVCHTYVVCFHYVSLLCRNFRSICGVTRLGSDSSKVSEMSLLVQHNMDWHDLFQKDQDSKCAAESCYLDLYSSFVIDMILVYLHLQRCLSQTWWIMYAYTETIVGCRAVPCLFAHPLVWSFGHFHS